MAVIASFKTNHLLALARQLNLAVIPGNQYVTVEL